MVPGPRGVDSPELRRVRARTALAGALLVSLAVGGCGVGTGGPPASAPSPLPSPAATTACTPDLGSAPSARVAAALVALRFAVADELDLVEAVEAVFGKPISAMGATERAEVLHVLAGLDSCPDQPARVRDRVPHVVHLLADQGSGQSRIDAKPTPDAP